MGDGITIRDDKNRNNINAILATTQIGNKQFVTTIHFLSATQATLAISLMPLGYFRPGYTYTWRRVKTTVFE
jgi:hypothetical protein